jgi:hypothetical protein
MTSTKGLPSYVISKSPPRRSTLRVLLHHLLKVGHARQSLAACVFVLTVALATFAVLSAHTKYSRAFPNEDDPTQRPGADPRPDGLLEWRSAFQSEVAGATDAYGGDPLVGIQGEMARSYVGQRLGSSSVVDAVRIKNRGLLQLASRSHGPAAAGADETHKAVIAHTSSISSNV